MGLRYIPYTRQRSGLSSIHYFSSFCVPDPDFDTLSGQDNGIELFCYYMVWGGGCHFVKSFMNLEHLKSSFDPIDL